MAPASLKSLFGYNDWANNCVRHTAADLNDEQLDRPFDMGAGHLRGTLAHIYGAERAWYERCAGPEADTLPHSRDTHTLDDLRQASKRLATLRDNWLATFADADLVREICYTKDEHTYTHALRDVLLHVCNHGVHHRAQAINMLRRLGKRVPMLDLLVMRIQQRKRAPMTADLPILGDYYAYTDWANGRVFDIAATLSDELLRRTFEMGMSCILKTLAHLRDAEQWWYQNWHNGGVFDFEQVKQETTVQQLRKVYRETLADRIDYFSGLASGDLDRTVKATQSEGQTWTFTLGESMLQLCCHGTHHRAQIINMFRHVGAEVPALDYIAMKRDEWSR